MLKLLKESLIFNCGENKKTKLPIVLRVMREEKGFSLRYLEMKTGVSAQTISKWECEGCSTVDHFAIVRIADVLGVSVHFLITGTPSKSEKFSSEIMKQIENQEGEIRELKLKNALLEHEKKNAPIQIDLEAYLKVSEL